MDTLQAIGILKKLADGVDPETGKQYEKDTPYQRAETVRALNEAIVAIETANCVSAKKKDGPPKAGKAWSEEEEKEMVEMFDANVKVADIAKTLERTNGAIWARLEKVGRVSRDENGKVIVKPVAKTPAPEENKKTQLIPEAACEF